MPFPLLQKSAARRQQPGPVPPPPTPVSAVPTVVPTLVHDFDFSEAVLGTAELGRTGVASVPDNISAEVLITTAVNKEPTYKKDAFGRGRHGSRFERGTAHQLEIAALVVAIPAPYSITVIYREMPDLPDGLQFMVYAGTGGGGVGIQKKGQDSVFGGGLQASHHGGATSGPAFDGGSGAHVVTSAFPAAAAAEIFLDGLNRSPLGAVGSLPIDDAFYVGNALDQSFQAECTFARILVHDAVLSDAEIETIAAWSQAEYGTKVHVELPTLSGTVVADFDADYGVHSQGRRWVDRVAGLVADTPDITLPAYAGVFDPGKFNGRPGVRFRNLAHLFEPTLPSRSQPFTFVVVFSDVDNDIQGTLVGTPQPTSIQTVPTGNIRVTGGAVTAGTPLEAGGVHVVIGIINGASSETVLDGVSSGPENAGGNVSGIGLVISALVSGDPPIVALDTTQARVLFLDYAATVADQEALLDWARLNYGTKDPV